MRDEPAARDGVSSIANLRQASRLLSRRLVVVGVLVTLCLIGGATFVITEMRAKQLLETRRELLTLNTVLAEETARAMQSVDLVLRNVIESFTGDEPLTSESFLVLATGRQTHDSLKAKTAGIPQLDAVTVVGADGRLLNFSRYFPIPDIDLSDRDYFARLRDNAVIEPFVTEPVQNRGTGTWTIYLSRRLVGADGRFLGLVMGAIDLNYFDSFYRSLKLGGQSAISLWRQDGTLLTREPAIAGGGRQFKIEAFAPEIMAQQGGYYEISDAIDGAARLVATRAITGYPMVINVTRTRDEVLKDWTREAFFGVGATALCIIAILLILWTLGRQSRANIVQAEAHLAREEAVRAREAAEAQLRQSQKMEAIGQLTGGIAHDFNNLLNVVMANLEWIERQLHNDPKLLGRVRDAISGAERAAETTHMLLAFARQQAPSAITTDVNRLIQTFARLLRTTLGGQITLTLDLAPDLPSLLVDTNQLENALLNLAVNARDAMPKGGSLTIATRVSAAEASGNEPRIVIDVTDTGPGMPPEVAAQAFDAFFTTKEVGKGTGLGLNQVLRFVRTCEGEATIASREGEGTTIRLVLPTGKPAPSSRMAA